MLSKAQRSGGRDEACGRCVALPLEGGGFGWGWLNRTLPHPLPSREGNLLPVLGMWLCMDRTSFDCAQDTPRYGPLLRSALSFDKLRTRLRMLS